MCKKWVMVLLMMGVVSGCVTVPSGPNVMVLPASGKPFDQFQADDLLCRQYAQQQIGITPGQAAAQSTVNTAAIGTVLGAAAGAAIGAAAGNAGTGAAIGAGTGLLVGTAGGAQAGSASTATLQWRYDMSYTQCMYAKGNQVPGASVPPPRSMAPPPPPPGLPPPPPPGVQPPYGPSRP
ncbi:MAG: glycine zipper family protein [Candidatus Entotheonellia bacterium]